MSSSDILPHLTQPPRDTRSQHTSSESDTLEAIEAELNEMKKEVSKLKEIETRDSRSSEEEPETMAAKLMRLHDSMTDDSRVPPPAQSKAPLPPRATDFPALGSGKLGANSPSPTNSSQGKQRISYASAATAGMKDAIDQAFPGARSKRADSKVDAGSDPPLSVTSFGSTLQQTTTLTSPTSVGTGARRSVDHEDADGSVIISPKSAMTNASMSEALLIGKDMPSSPNGKSDKGTPRFAQPTASFARRAGETLRKDSVARRSPGDTPPTKSVRTKEAHHDTEKGTAHHVSKRKSLPFDWKNDSPQSNISGAGVTSSPLIMSSPTSNGDWQFIDKAPVESISTVIEASPQKLPRKKTSSYMLPTAAATQRTIATLGEETAKRKPGTLRINTAQANQSTSLTSPESVIVTSVNSLDIASMEGRGTGSSISPTSPQRRLIDAVLARGSIPSSPIHAHRHGAEKTPASPKSPSKIPRACMAGTTPFHELRGDASKVQSHAATPEQLNAVANITRKRQTSHADILKPILDKLDSQGLLKDKPSVAKLSDAKAREIRHDSIGALSPPVHNVLPETPRKPSAALTDIALLARQGIAGRKVVVPPHLRVSRQSSVASNSTDASSFILVAPQPSRVASQATQATPYPTKAEDTAAKARDEAVFESDLKPWSTQLQPPPAPRPASAQMLKPFPASSLRPTAQEFKPLWKPQNLAQEFRLLSWQGSLDYLPEDQWSAMPLDIRHSIQMLREFKTNGTRPAGTMSDRTFSPSKRQEQRFWGNLMPTPAVPAPHSAAIPIRDRDSDALMLDVAANAGTVSRHGVQVGQVFKPALSPGKKNVHWTLQDVDGKSKPVTFGRAPPPSTPDPNDVVTGDTPFVSPRSDDTSPLKTPHSVQAWTIGSGGYAPGPYGWKGGDGKEISFRGYGPHAERDPNSPINMHYFGGGARSSSFGGTTIRSGFSPPGTFENTSPSPMVWPRSRRQWAELAGYNKVPCGNVEIAAGVEQIPFSAPSAGHCNDCVADKP